MERICPRADRDLLSSRMSMSHCSKILRRRRLAQSSCRRKRGNLSRFRLFEKFHIWTLFGSFYINCSVTYRYILVKRHLDIKNCPTAQLLHYAAGHYNFVICRRARRFQHQRLWSNPHQGRRRESFSRRGSQGCSADICEAVLRRKRDRIRGR